MENDKKVSFFEKDPKICPVCKTSFHLERLYSGGGRLYAVSTADDLRRIYKPTSSFGRIIPTIYSMAVCPKCFYSAYQNDFMAVRDDEIRDLIRESNSRILKVKRLFHENADFCLKRSLVTGAASYVLASDCYKQRNEKASPLVKIAISNIRAAWLFGDLSAESSNKFYSQCSETSYKIALEYYKRSINKNEDYTGIFLGPDNDYNYSYEGIVYLIAHLEMKLNLQYESDGQKLKEFKNNQGLLTSFFFKRKPPKIFDEQRITDKVKELYHIYQERISVFEKAGRI